MCSGQKKKIRKQGNLTNFRHLRHSCDEGSVEEFGGVVINVLNFYNELWLWLQGFVGVEVDGLRVKNIMWFLFPVQTFGGVDVSRYLVDDEDTPCSFTAKDVPDRTIAFVWIRM